MHGEEINVNSSNSESEEASSDQGSNDDSDSKLHQSSPTQSGGGEEPDGNHEPLLNFLLGPDTSVDSMSQPTEARMDSSDSPDLSSSKTAEKLEPSGSVAASPTSKSDDKKGPKSSSTVTVFLHRQTETSDGSVDSSLGGSVVRALCESRQFRVRGITRNPDSPKAKEFKQQGVEMVKGDLDSPEELEKAFAGAHGIFVTTNFWQPSIMANPEQEIQQGKNAADAAKKVGVQHLVWSSLPNVAKTTSGKFTKVHHFDNKAKVEDYMRSLDLPLTVVRYGFYMSNMVEPAGNVHRGSDGVYQIEFPVSGSTIVPPFAAEIDGGRCMLHCFLNPRETIGRVYDLACCQTTLQTMVDTMAKRAGKEIRLVELNSKQAMEHPAFSNPDMYEMFQFYKEFGCFMAKESIDETRDTFGPLLHFEDYLIHIGWTLP
ncbi:hypothetical protein IWQ62_004906 [Dispira parvispora]|uniref:NmrA-like domain-containing protein n=1 Tax=Dispira parvispora TaxID=1520584 RepID=A0A9W8E064_9FUNG|nr:hypothetical protein IWQ62_004906 [Dispira parvispora]